MNKVKKKLSKVLRKRFLIPFLFNINFPDQHAIREEDFNKLIQVKKKTFLIKKPKIKDLAFRIRKLNKVLRKKNLNEKIKKDNKIHKNKFIYKDKFQNYKLKYRKDQRNQDQFNKNQINNFKMKMDKYKNNKYKNNKYKNKIFTNNKLNKQNLYNKEKNLNKNIKNKI